MGGRRRSAWRMTGARCRPTDSVPAPPRRPLARRSRSPRPTGLRGRSPRCPPATGGTATATTRPSERRSTQAWLMDHSLALSIRSADRDPQLRRDVHLAGWSPPSTVVPVAAVPLLFAGGAIYAADAPAPHCRWYCSSWPAWPRPLSPGGSSLPSRSGTSPPAPAPRPKTRIARLNSIRADLTHTQAAELERIERSLHDGAQARIVALGMYLNAAEGLIDTDPEQAKQILREARASTGDSPRPATDTGPGHQPPGARRAGPGRRGPSPGHRRPTRRGCPAAPSRVAPNSPIEAALYFAIAELLTNVVKHSHATHANIELSHASRRYFGP